MRLGLVVVILEAICQKCIQYWPQDIEVNYIFDLPIKIRSDFEITSEYQNIFTLIKDKGYKPIIHWMDNETLLH